MQNTGFVWLGSRRARKWNVADKGRLLDQAASAGLPVPSGGILLDEFYQLLIRERALEVVDSEVRVPDPELLLDAVYAGIRFPPIPYPGVIRAICPIDDSTCRRPDAAVAWMPIDLQDAQQLADGLSKAYSTALTWHRVEEASGSALRRDLMLMAMVKAVTSGSATSIRQRAMDEVQHEGQTHVLPRLGFWRSPDASAPPFLQRLQKLMRGVRRSFGKMDLQVDWIDDGDICWLIQLRQATSSVE